MPLPPPNIVILDMDGTTVRHLNPRVLHALEVADDMMYRTRIIFSQISTWLGKGSPFRFRRSTRKPRLIVHRTLHKIRRKPVEQIVEPCPGIIDLLELFKAHNIPVGLVSNGLGKGYGYDILSKFDLVPLLSACVFREDITRSKPDPEPILTVLSRFEKTTGPGDIIWYIGDRSKDITAARSAAPHLQAKIIPIGYGLNAAMSLFENNLGTDHLVLSYEEWYPIVEDLLSKTKSQKEQMAAYVTAE